jgi:hypothetical protein
MNHDKIRTRSAKARQEACMSLAPQPQQPAGIAAPVQGGLLRWLALAGIVAVGIGAVLIFMTPEASKRVLGGAFGKAESKLWKPQPWKPLTEEERIIDRFFTLHENGDKAALEQLCPAPVFDDEPVSEKTAEARQTDFFLRSDLRFRDLWRGEPDGKGGQRDVPGRFTIVTKGSASAPKLRIRTERGVDPPSQLMMSSPDLVVEVRKGKIYGLRAELHMGP